MASVVDREEGGESVGDDGWTKKYLGDMCGGVGSCSKSWWCMGVEDVGD